jgi:hypothetical protein
MKYLLGNPVCLAKERVPGHPHLRVFHTWKYANDPNPKKTIHEVIIGEEVNTGMWEKIVEYRFTDLREEEKNRRTAVQWAIDSFVAEAFLELKNEAGYHKDLMWCLQKVLHEQDARIKELQKYEKERNKYNKEKMKSYKQMLKDATTENEILRKRIIEQRIEALTG